MENLLFLGVPILKHIRVNYILEGLYKDGKADLVPLYPFHFRSPGSSVC